MPDAETITAPVTAKGRTLVGYASVWGAEANIGGEFTEEFSPGAFDLTGDVRFLWGHRHDRVIARTGNRTLRLSQDNYGLKLEVDLPNTSDGDDLLELVRLQTVTGLSVSFWPRVADWTFKGRDIPHCLVRKAGLLEVSAVAWPAYDATEIAPAEPAGPDTAESIRARMMARERARKQSEIDKRRRALEAAR